MRNNNLSPEGQRLLDLDRLARALYRAGELEELPSWTWEQAEERERLERLLAGHGVVVATRD